MGLRKEGKSEVKNVALSGLKFVLEPLGRECFFRCEFGARKNIAFNEKNGELNFLKRPVF